MAALGTITGTIERIRTEDGRPPLVVIALTCTASADDNSYPSTIINDLAGVSDYDLRGLKLYSVATIPGTVGPTDNTDLVLNDRYGIDIMAGAGVNLIDNTAKNRSVIGIASAILVTGDITCAITGNAVPSAVTTIVLELIGV
uniref:Uncharacterized protein n=1 Tax=viral metagenome TaxID=1070528 RepID=A0A6M3KP13_9ZZZZ